MKYFEERFKKTNNQEKGERSQNKSQVFSWDKLDASNLKCSSQEGQLVGLTLVETEDVCFRCVDLDQYQCQITKPNKQKLKERLGLEK